MLTPEERADRIRGIMRDRAARRRLADRVSPELPVDGDPPELRRRADRIGDSLSGVMESLLAVPNAFFDRLTSEWTRLFPDVRARPVGFEEDTRTFRIFLAVANAGLSFALRPQLPRIRRALKEIEGAPRKKIEIIVRIG